MKINYISKKIDLSTANVIAGLLCAIPVGVIPFIQNYVGIYVLIFVLGYSYAICSYFMMNSIMEKCKIISATNKALIARQDGILAGQILCPIIIIICGEIAPVFFVMVGGIALYAIYTKIVENKLRRKLVDYIENNEIEN